MQFQEQITNFVVLPSFVSYRIADISLKFISLPKIRKMRSLFRAHTNVILVLADSFFN